MKYLTFKTEKRVQRISYLWGGRLDIIHAQFKGIHPSANSYPFTLRVECTL